LLNSPLAETPNHGFTFSTDFTGNLLEGTLIVPHCVCFCDIPKEEIGLHTQKYGPFGLSFSKTALARKRARPVIYLPVWSGDWRTPMDGRGAVKDIEAVYKSLPSFLPQNWSSTFASQYTTPEELICAVQCMLDHQVLCFIKPFNVERADDDPRQYYMEREWRILGSLQFELSEVVRVFLPKTFIKRFKSDFPEYKGAITAT
jgi:hypothetical protein